MCWRLRVEDGWVDFYDHSFMVLMARNAVKIDETLSAKCLGTCIVDFGVYALFSFLFFLREKCFHCLFQATGEKCFP